MLKYKNELKLTLSLDLFKQGDFDNHPPNILQRLPTSQNRVAQKTFTSYCKIQNPTTRSNKANFPKSNDSKGITNKEIFNVLNF